MDDAWKIEKKQLVNNERVVKPRRRVFNGRDLGKTHEVARTSVSHPDAPTDAALPGARRKTSRSSGEAPCHVSTRLDALTGLSQLSVPLFCFYTFWSKTVKTIELVAVANRGETGEEKWGRTNHNWHAKHINRMPEWHVSSLGRFCHVLFTQKILQFIFNLRHLGRINTSVWPQPSTRLIKKQFGHSGGNESFHNGPSREKVAFL